MRKRANILATRSAADCESSELRQPPGTSRHLQRVWHAMGRPSQVQGRELRASPGGATGSARSEDAYRGSSSTTAAIAPIAHAASPSWRWPPAASAASSHIPPSSTKARRAGTAATCHRLLWARKT
jgi:hypothetical protein